MATTKSTAPLPEMGERVSLLLNEIRPYWRNPRRISDEAVTALMSSLETYGYVVPITVDADNVIITGHTRYTALRRMGVEAVEVLRITSLNDEQVKRFRIIDNRSGEYSQWDFDKLTAEVERLGEDVSPEEMALLFKFFPELDQQQIDAVLDTDEKQQADAQPEDPWKAEFVCPHCFHAWEAKIDRDDVLKGRIPASAATTEEKRA